MIKKHVLLTIALIAILFSAQAQDCDGRYLEEIFDNVDVSTVVYSDVTGFTMDIYQPAGDEDIEERPLILFAHGGSFSAGTPQTQTMISMCTAFAKRGYVAASYQYSLTNAINLLDSVFMINHVMKAVADGKSAVRYFRKDYEENNNTYRIDSEQIFVGGNSAGAILAMHLAYLQYDEAPDYIQTAIDANGGIEGNAGNDGYSSDVKGVVNLAGGLNQLSFIDPNDVPVVSFHGDADEVVPYDCNSVFWGTLGNNLVNICGSGTMQPVLDYNGVPNSLTTYPGADHVPWESSPGIYEEIHTTASAFLYDYIECESTISSIETLEDMFVSAYPNPAQNNIYLQWNGDRHENVNIQLVNNLGQVLYINNGNSSSIQQIEAAGLPRGVYSLIIRTEKSQLINKILLD